MSSEPASTRGPGPGPSDRTVPVSRQAASWRISAAVASPAPAAASTTGASRASHEGPVSTTPWSRAHVVAEDSEVQRILNLYVFHLLQTASPHVTELDAGLPARGLHGEAYRGHVFWDDLFVFPFLAPRFPEVTRALLRYRWRRLPEARWAARAAGYTGAMFPWQSGGDGREETPRLHFNPRSGRWLPDNSRLQRHVGLAVAHNVWQHYEATKDSAFLAGFGGELLLEIARFFASLTTREGERYVIRGVMGPDEYHD